MQEVGIYDSSAIWSKELIAAFLFPLWASNTERITSLSMLGNMSWIDFRSSSLHRCWGLTAGGGIATGIMSGLQTAGIPAHTKKIQHKHVRKINDSEEESGSSLATNPPTSAFIYFLIYSGKEISKTVAIRTHFSRTGPLSKLRSKSNMATGTAQN